jgi:lysophospholipase
MRAGLALALLVLLAACGERTAAPFFDSRTPPQVPPSAWPPHGWAWGSLRVGDAPPMRYGVSAPSTPALAHVVVLPGYGESAEVYFETARDLNARGIVVWVLEGAGQGGSARVAWPRDAVHTQSLDTDAAAVGRLIREVVRPLPGRPVTIAAHGQGALPALLAVEGGLREVDGIYLWSPDLRSPELTNAAAVLGRTAAARLRALGEKGWERPNQDLTRREALPQAWALANPDLRTGGASWGRLAAVAGALKTIEAGGRLRTVTAPVVVRGEPTVALRSLCSRLSACRLEATAGGPEHLANDPIRDDWLNALGQFTLRKAAPLL